MWHEQKKTMKADRQTVWEETNTYAHTLSQYYDLTILMKIHTGTLEGKGDKDDLD